MMTLTLSENANPNYVAAVVRIEELVKHPNADRLQLAIINGEEIVVDMSAQIGDVMVHFPIESQLDAAYLAFNNLYRAATANCDPAARGFFEANGRVRAMRLRGVVSNGLLMPLASLAAYAPPAGKIFEINTKFDTVETDNNKFLLLKKYVPKYTRTPGGGKDAKYVRRQNLSKRFVDKQWRFHYDTEKLENNMDMIFPASKLSISVKMHGTSIVCGRILVHRLAAPRLNKWLQRLGINTAAYKNVWASRKVIKNKKLKAPKDKNTHFYADDIWTCAYKDVFKPVFDNFNCDGVTFYAEIVGYLPSGGGIQGDYDYMCAPPTRRPPAFTYGKNYKVYIYRITETDKNGNVFEARPNELQQLCELYGLTPVISLVQDVAAKDMYPIPTDDLARWRKEFYQALKKDPRFHLEEASYYCKNKVPEEGIVVAVEGGKAYKLKAKAFLLKETEMLNAAAPDIETAQE